MIKRGYYEGVTRMLRGCYVDVARRMLRYADVYETFRRLLRDYYETTMRLLRDCCETVVKIL